MALDFVSQVPEAALRPCPELEKLLHKFANRAPEVTFEWHDKETSAKGYLIINSLRGGAAGGGTRMHKSISRDEMLSLAKTMEIKFTVSGPSIGGGKSGIAFDPEDPRKEEVLKRWFAAIAPLLQRYYGTGGDLNIDEVKEVIPITAAQGLAHPQAGIVCGHFGKDKEPAHRKIKRLQEGIIQPIVDTRYTALAGRYALADLITGYGVAEAVRHYYRIWHKEQPKQQRAIIQGWGNVAAATALYLAKQGVQIVGIIDRAGGLLDTKGLSEEDVRKLFLQRSQNRLSAKQLIPFDEANARIWDLGAEIFVPAAASRLVSRSQSERLIHAGLRVVACGANVPFVEDEIFYGPTTQYVDDRIALLPDFIASSAMARVFAYLMSKESENHTQPSDIFEDASNCIAKALQKIQNTSPTSKHISRVALHKALQEVL